MKASDELSEGCVIIIIIRGAAGIHVTGEN